MQQKINSSVGSGAQVRNKGLYLSDKYVALQYQAERDHYREQAQGKL